METDLLDAGALAALPDCPNVVYMCGLKFGSTGAEWNQAECVRAERMRHALTVAHDVGLPALVDWAEGEPVAETPPGTAVVDYEQRCNELQETNDGSID